MPRENSVNNLDRSLIEYLDEINKNINIIQRKNGICKKCDRAEVVWKSSLSEPGTDCFECQYCFNLTWEPR
jgi:hypothetical protein